MPYLGASPPPVRFLSGESNDGPYQPLADCGAGNMAFYHYFFDDFDILHGTYTQTKTGNGTIANAAGDGGLALFTTNSSTPATTDIASLQGPAAGYSLTAGKKLFFQAKLQLSDVTNSAIVVGLIQTTATPFTVTDGIYFSKASGSTTLNINSVVGSVATTVAIPATATTLTNATYFEVAFYLTRLGDVLAFVDNQLAGYIPQSTSVQNTNGPVARILAPTLTTANLNITAALQSGTASSKTMTLDFFGAAKER